MKKKALPGQSLLDMAMQLYGSIERVFELSVENGLNVTDHLPAGKELNYNLTNAVDNQVLQYYRINTILPATATGVSESGIFDETFDLTFE